MWILSRRNLHVWPSITLTPHQAERNEVPTFHHIFHNFPYLSSLPALNFEYPLDLPRAAEHDFDRVNVSLGCIPLVLHYSLLN
jgi:hypothetical protein